MGNFKNLLNQRLAEHRGKGEKEDKDEEPLPIETKGSSKDIEYKADAWDSHFANHHHEAMGEPGFRAHAETEKGNQIEDMIDQKSYAQKETHKHGHHHHHSHAQT